MVPSSSGAFVSSKHMHFIDQIPVDVLHFLERDVPEDACVIDEHIHSSETVQGSLDDLVSELNRVVVGHSHSALGLDFVDHLIGSLVVVALSAVGASQVIDDYFGASGGEEQGVLFADSVACSGDYDYFSVESQSHVSI